MITKSYTIHTRNGKHDNSLGFHELGDALYTLSEQEKNPNIHMFPDLRSDKDYQAEIYLVRDTVAEVIPHGHTEQIYLTAQTRDQIGKSLKFLVENSSRILGKELVATKVKVQIHREQPQESEKIPA